MEWLFVDSTKSHFYSEFGLNSDELGNSERLQQRAARFSSNLKSSASSASSQTAPQRRKKPLSLVTTIANMGIYEDLCGDIDWSEFHVVGTCQDIEKPYLRLTSVSIQFYNLGLQRRQLQEAGEICIRRVCTFCQILLRWPNWGWDWWGK